MQCDAIILGAVKTLNRDGWYSLRKCRGHASEAGVRIKGLVQYYRSMSVKSIIIRK